jgi:hypothetical protein
MATFTAPDSTLSGKGGCFVITIFGILRCTVQLIFYILLCFYFLYVPYLDPKPSL